MAAADGWFIRIRQVYSGNVLSHKSTLAPPGEYYWTCAFFGKLESTTQTAPRSIASSVFVRAKTDEAIEVPFGLYFTTVCPFPFQNYPFQWGIDWTSGKCDSRQCEVYSDNWVPFSPCLVGLYQ